MLEAGQEPVNGRSQNGADVRGKGEALRGDGGGRIVNTGKCTHAKGKKKMEERKKNKTTKQPKKKKKTRNPNGLKSVGSLALCFVLPDGGLCSATGVEPEALSVPFPPALLGGSSVSHPLSCRQWGSPESCSRA